VLTYLEYKNTTAVYENIKHRHVVRKNCTRVEESLFMNPKSSNARHKTSTPVGLIVEGYAHLLELIPSEAPAAVNYIPT